MTNDTPIDHTPLEGVESAASTELDPRIVELVRFLARAAAEKDYANLLAKSHRETETGSEKETIQ